ncbi:MAG: hypothetical protein COV99_03915 [Bacteroidetes bacterium CG12_big_fil_rev_8_21_14_0_65_60_17]|nr:MAG: hypothetical protein COV99_03915 [Bacteroidetes bacterium CG12_big_fil_rev_8_21_14_0_65_60_17]
MTCPLLLEEDLNLYLDGELPGERQKPLFNHLSACRDCQATMESVLAFRRMSRQEVLVPSPSADEGFFKRLCRLKRAGRTRDRLLERGPVWREKRPVTVRAASMTVAAVFIIGILAPEFAGSRDPVVSSEMETVDLNAPVVTGAPVTVRQSYIHVFYPGITVEADSLDER